MLNAQEFNGAPTAGAIFLANIHIIFGMSTPNLAIDRHLKDVEVLECNVVASRSCCTSTIALARLALAFGCSFKKADLKNIFATGRAVFVQEIEGGLVEMRGSDGIHWTSRQSYTTCCVSDQMPI
jgi:hypothetical protein